MANNDQTDGTPITSLEDWKAKKASKEEKKKERVISPRKLVKLKLLPYHMSLLKKVKQQEKDKTDPEVFLKALSQLNQYNELLANGGQLFVSYDGSDVPPVEFDFDE